MTMGHFATALVPYSKLKGAPLWLLLLCAQLPDFVWLTLALTGTETPHPANLLDVTINTMQVDMLYSHTGLGTVLLAAAATVAILAISRNVVWSIWGGLLVIGHWLCDLLSGWKHPLTHGSSYELGLNLYVRSPYLAFGIEALFSALLCIWFVRSEAAQGRALTPKRKLALYAVVVGGSMFFLGTATVSMRTLLHLG
jgi:hypothetical protein